MWGYVLNSSFVPIHSINNEIVNKYWSIWTTEENEKLKQEFQDKYLMISALSTREYNYTLNIIPAKEVWDTFEEIYEVPIKIKKKRNGWIHQVKMNKISKDGSKVLKSLTFISEIACLTNG